MDTNLQPKLTGAFLQSAATLLVACATALILGNIAGNGLAQPHDILLGISIRNLFWILIGCGLVVALYCIFGKIVRLKLALVSWLALNLILYRLGLHWMGAQGIGGYVGNLARSFHLASDVTSQLMQLCVLYLFVGSAGFLIWHLVRREEVSLKAICTHCGGHIGFAAQNLGQKTPCPHCQKPTTLRMPENLKMSCFFCKEHIEFPSHAIGEKLKCPHCQMDITLKEAGV